MSQLGEQVFPLTVDRGECFSGGFCEALSWSSAGVLSVWLARFGYICFCGFSVCSWVCSQSCEQSLDLRSWIKKRAKGVPETLQVYPFLSSINELTNCSVGSLSLCHCHPVQSRRWLKAFLGSWTVFFPPFFCLRKVFCSSSIS